MAASTLTLLACSNQPPSLSYTVDIDPMFTSDQMESISAGLDKWRTSLPELRVDTFVAHCGASLAHHVCMQPAFDPPNPSDDVIGMTEPGMTGNATVLIYVDRIQAVASDDAQLIAQTAAHEMGHVMGLRHSSPGELMAPTVSQQASVVTARDIAQFWTVRGQ